MIGGDGNLTALGQSAIANRFRYIERPRVRGSRNVSHPFPKRDLSVSRINASFDGNSPLIPASFVSLEISVDSIFRVRVNQ